MKPDEMSQNPPPPRTEGSNPSLSATSLPEKIRDKRDKPLFSTAPAENLGAFALPFNKKEFVHHLVNGSPVEIPRFRLFPWLRHLEDVCSTAEVKVACNAQIAQITPVTVIAKQPEGVLV